MHEYIENPDGMAGCDNRMADACEENVAPDTVPPPMTPAQQEFSEWLQRRQENSVPDDDNDDMEENLSRIRKVLDGLQVEYREKALQGGIYSFALDIITESRRLYVKIYLESDPKVCRIDAIYPFRAVAAFAYPLCEQMAKENYLRRYGVLKYDETDGELSTQYSFPIGHGLYEDDFFQVLMTVVKSADISYDWMKQYATGQFDRERRKEMTYKAQWLIIDLN